MIFVTTAVFLLTPHPDFGGYLGYLGYLDIYYLSLGKPLDIPRMRLYIDFIVSWYTLEKLFGVWGLAFI